MRKKQFKNPVEFKRTLIAGDKLKVMYHQAIAAKCLYIHCGVPVVAHRGPSNMRIIFNLDGSLHSCDGIEK